MPEYDEQQIIDREQEIEAALTAAGIPAEVFHDEDGDEGWHLTIGAGHEHYREGGGTGREFGLTFWTRSDEWLWDRLRPDGHKEGPWPCRDLDAGSAVAEVVAYVRRNVVCADPDPEHLASDDQEGGSTRG